MTWVVQGRVQLDEHNRPTGVLEDDPSISTFLILDLKTRQIVKSIEIARGFGFDRFRPVWSPNSELFVYLDETGNWQLFQIGSSQILPVTVENGDRLEAPSWSFDGRTLQLVYETPWVDCGDGDCIRQTYLLDVEPGE